MFCAPDVLATEGPGCAGVTYIAPPRNCCSCAAATRRNDIDIKNLARAGGEGTAEELHHVAKDKSNITPQARFYF